MMKTKALRAARVLLLMGALAGCGQLDLVNGTLGTESDDLQAMRMGGPRGSHGFKAHGGPSMGDHAPGFGFLMGLDLSEEQQEQVREILETYRPAKPGAKLAELLKAEPLDVEALRTALDAAPKKFPGMPVEALAAIREVLTEAQRAEVVSRFSEMPLPSDGERPQPPSLGDRLDRIAQTLDLSDEQQAALEAFKAKLPSPPQPADPEAHRDAMIALFETGDASALSALMPPQTEAPAFPVDEFLALAHVMNAEQRTALLAPPQHGHRFAGHRPPMR